MNPILTLGPTAVWTLDLNVGGREWPPTWSDWDNHGLPIGLSAELAWSCPELPEAAAHATSLAPELRQAIVDHGARAGVERFLQAATDRLGLLDRRALVVLLASLSLMTIRARLPLPAECYADVTHLRRRILRPLEFAAMRVAVTDPPRVVLLRLLAAGAKEPEIAALRTSQVTIHPDGAVWVTLGGSRGSLARTLPLAPGATADVAALLANSADGYLIPLDVVDEPQERLETIDKKVRRVLQMTGLASDPTVTVASIRNTGLRAVHDRFGLESAAACAGTRNLQLLRRELGMIAHRPRRSQAAR